MEFRQEYNAPRTPAQGVQYGDNNLQRNYFAPVTVNLFSSGFERLRDVCFDPRVLKRDLDLPRFTGREWLVRRIDDFLLTRSRGYIIVLAEAGVGKSSLAAHLVFSNPWLYHFTRLSGGRSPEAARKSLAAQLISRWRLDDWAPGGVLPSSADRPDWFDRLLSAAADRRDEREPDEKIVLVVDGLDEFEEGTTGGVGLRLGLPISLPDGVYVIATSRFGIERVFHAVRNPAEWHQIEVEGRDNLDDMRRFIDAVTDPGTGDERLIRALRKDGIELARFRETLGSRCAGIWIYLRYVLDEIRDGERDPRHVDRLPADLAGYYAEQIARWRGDPDSAAQQARWEQLYLPLLATLGAARAPLTVAELESFSAVATAGLARAFVEETARAFLNRHEQADQVRYGIRHQSFRDLLAGTVPGSRPDLVALATMFAAQARLAQQRIARVLIPPGAPGERDWSASSAYARQHLASHAAACGLLEDLLNDPGFLVTARPDSVLANRANLRTIEAWRSSAALRLSMDGWANCDMAERLDRLAVNAARMRAAPLIDACATLTGQTWPIRWAAIAGHIHQILEGHRRSVRAVAIGRAADRDIIVSGSADRTIRIWDAATGDRVGNPLTGHEGAVSAVATGRAGEREVIVSGSDDGTLRIWDAATGDQVGDPLTGHAAAVNAVAIGRAAGRDVIVSGSGDETVQVWDGVTGEPLGEPLAGDCGVVNAVAIGQAAGRAIIVAGCEDCTLRVWDAVTGEPVGDPLTGHDDWVNAVTIGHTADGDVIVSGSQDGTIRVWDAETGELVRDPLIRQEQAVAAVAIGQAAGADVVISCPGTGGFSVLDARTGEPIAEPPSGQAGEVTAVAIGHAAGTDMIVAGASNGTVLAWDAAILDPLLGHESPVAALALGQVAGRDVLVSGALDYVSLTTPEHVGPTVVRVWDARTGDSICAPLASRRASVWSVAIAQVAGRGVILSAAASPADLEDDDPYADDGSPPSQYPLGLWNAVTGESIGELTGHRGSVYAVALGRVAGRDVAVSGGSDCTVLVWDVGTRKTIGELTGHSDTVLAVALGRLAGRDVVVSGSADRSVLVWDAVTGERVGELTGHRDAVYAVALGRVGGRDVIVSGSADHSVFLREHRSPDPARVTSSAGPALSL